MQTIRLGSIFQIVVTLLLGASGAGATTPGGSEPGSTPTVVRQATPDQVAKLFKELQDRNHALVQELAGHYYVYGLEGNDLTKFRGPNSWFSYSIEVRERIENIIEQIVRNTEEMIACARTMEHPELAAQAQDEEMRAKRLIASLEAYKAHDHNHVHLHEAKPR